MGDFMKKIVPFKKDIIFKSNVAEITSISLEHSLHLEKDNLITGQFHLNGEYLMTDTSTDTEVFSYDIPFDIHLDERYIVKNAEINIYDFYYEIIDNNVLNINIEVSIDKLEEKEVEKEVVELESVRNEPVVIDVLDEHPKIVEEKIEKIDINEKSNEVKVEVVDNKDFTTYKIYILREEDNIETVMQKYSISRERLEEYNNLNELKIGDKLIIPSE